MHTVSRFEHVFEASPSGESPITVLALHGTGGNEHDLVPLARQLASRAAILSPRGRVLENGMPRFFRRLAEGVFDLEDLTRRTHELADFVAAAAERYQFDAARVVAVGFSNGANIASSLLLLRPETLAGAVLFRGMVPIVPPEKPLLSGIRVLLSNGRRDPLVTMEETERLKALLASAGADVTLAWQPSGHDLTPADVPLARTWLEEQQWRPSARG
jgi:predicted esterase